MHDDLVDRRYTAPAPNVLWLTDITEHRTAEGGLGQEAVLRIGAAAATATQVVAA